MTCFEPHLNQHQIKKPNRFIFAIYENQIGQNRPHSAFYEGSPVAGNENIGVMKIVKICENCGRSFTTVRRTTKYCSHKCSDAARKDRLLVTKLISLDATDLSSHEIFTVEMAAIYIGISHQTFYRWIAKGYVPITMVDGQKMVRRTDLDALVPKDSPLEIKREGRDLITVENASLAYGYSFTQCYRILTDEGVHMVHVGKTDLYDKAEVDRVLSRRRMMTPFIIAGWYTIEQIAMTYDMSDAAVRTMIHDYDIPCKRFNKIRLYSKEHVDAARKKAPPSIDNYMTIPEAMEKYSKTYDGIRYYMRNYHISKMIVGGRVFLSRNELKAIIEAPKFGE